MLFPCHSLYLFQHLRYLCFLNFRAVFMDWMDALKSIWKHLSIAVQRKETLDQIKENCFPKKSERRNIFVAFIMKENGKLRKKEQKRTEDLMLYGISYPFMMLANMKTKHKLLGDSKYAHTNTCHVHFYIHTHTHTACACSTQIGAYSMRIA